MPCCLLSGNRARWRVGWPPGADNASTWRQSLLGKDLPISLPPFVVEILLSGSLARSTLNQQAGAETRMSAFFCGLLMLLVLLFLGPVVALAPVASLAGLLLVLANDLIDRQRIRTVLHGTRE